MFRVYACGLWDLNVICENLRLITLGLRCVKRSHPFSFPVTLRRPPRFRVYPRPLVIPRPGVRMFSSSRRRVSRQASPFLSLPHQSMCARIHWLNSLRIICYSATDLALRATKHTARAVGRPMVGSVAAERHL